MDDKTLKELLQEWIDMDRKSRRLMLQYRAMLEAAAETVFPTPELHAAWQARSTAIFAQYLLEFEKLDAGEAARLAEGLANDAFGEEPPAE